MSVVKNYLITGSVVFFMVTAGLGCSVSNKRLKQIGAVVVIGLAAKLIYDMVIDSESTQTTNEENVISKYKAAHFTLPPQPLLVSYQSNIKPGEVVKAGNDISVVSSLEVVPGTSTRQVDIKEKIIIFDNEDHTKELKSLTKMVNKETRAGGIFKNQFTFKLPKGMPQGVYPIKTLVYVNGKAFAPNDNRMQLVMNEADTQSLLEVSVAP
ncbi:hypothetical protein [Aliikangiella maris]|uniref:Uncharacterized protein n=2 Tax=Aliikangiella maris TaxID=3162458 RepID=A0ABV2BT57_9GAMM